MRYNYKYAMPMDPRVLKQDYESEGVDTIPELVSLLKNTHDSDSFIKSNISQMTHSLWYDINEGKGINLRDREKLIPVFEEYDRIFKKYTRKHSVAYRGVSLPSIYKNILTENCDSFGQIDLNRNHEVKEVLEGLAYGLRSWTQQIEIAEDWAYLEGSDSVVFEYRNPNVIFDCDAFFKANMTSRYTPFDERELICFVENPKIASLRRTIDEGDYGVWQVRII
ncbi:hypothetical protein EB001_12320 [bacterium]|nr:hypothetical protein [bacterium]